MPRQIDSFSAALLFVLLGAGGCRGCDHSSPSASSASASVAPPSISEAPPSVTSSDSAPVPSSSGHVVDGHPHKRCSDDMVFVFPHRSNSDAGDTKSEYCVDRYEATLVDASTGKPITPYYPPDMERAKLFSRIWNDKKGSGTELEEATPLPPLPAWETEKPFQPKALSRAGAIPQGYANGRDAALACANAGKRVCTNEEWHAACRGESDRDFPYGQSYQAGQCNIFGPAHPGILLWDNATINHTDPRMNLVKFEGAPLLRRTGATKTCASRWGEDAIYDMVGNIDEWNDDKDGTFLGGFYARAKKDGCQSRVSTHPYEYADYSTGIRCCKDAEP